MKLQEYLNNFENWEKQEIKEINLTKIQQIRENNGESELLEGGELDLREFTNLEKVEIDPQFLSTPLVKIEVQGLTKLKEIDWLETKPESEEDKKLWTELGIEEKNAENISKKAVVKEVQKLVGLWNEETSESLKKVQVYFATEKSPKEQLKEDAMGITVIPEDEEVGYNIYLQLERKNKQGNFCPSLVFWNLAREFSVVGSGKIGEIPTSWTHFNQQLEWVRDNLIENYQKEFSQLLTPSTFPTEKLEISEFLSVYYPNREEIIDGQSKQFIVAEKIIDKTWQSIQKEIIELISQELEKNPSEEELKKIAVKLTILRYNLGLGENDFTIQLHYHSQIPFKTQLEQLITNTPLQLEIEHLKEEREQLPTPENFERLTEQNQAWENSLEDLGISEERLKEIKEKVGKIS